jgi:hypothetical protein
MKFYNLDSVTDSGSTGNLMLDVFPEAGQGIMPIQHWLTDRLPQSPLFATLAGVGTPTSEPFAIMAAFDDDDDIDDEDSDVDDEDDDFNDDDFDDDYDDDDFEDDDLEDDDFEDDDLDFEDDDLELDGNDDDFVDDDFGGSSNW